MAFEIKQGTNLSHWLSQSKARGEKRRAYIQHDDVKRIAGWGMDHVRLPIDEEQMWKEDGTPESEAFDLLNAGLDWCEAEGLRTVVDLHILRSHYFNDTEEPRLYRSQEELDRFVSLWGSLSEHLSKRSNDLVAYELLNEAVSRDPADWNRVHSTVFRSLRKLEPERTIVLGSNHFNSVNTYDDLEIPEDDHLILTFHYYHPMLVTHYTAHWWREGGRYDGPVDYPGRPLREEDIARYDADYAEKLRGWNKPHGKEVMQEELAQPLAARERSGRPLYCGEFGCYDRLPLEPRRRWYRDFGEVLRENGIAWANWDYKANFGLITPDGKDTGIREPLMGLGERV